MDDPQQGTDLAEQAGRLQDVSGDLSRIERATGILLVLCATTPHGAFMRLALASMSHDITPTTLAAAIVDVSSTTSPMFTRSVTPPARAHRRPRAARGVGHGLRPGARRHDRSPALALVVRTSQPVRRVLSPRAVAPARVATIHLGALLPTRSSGLPESSGGPPSNALCLTLLRVGFT